MPFYDLQFLTNPPAYESSSSHDATGVRKNRPPSRISVHSLDFDSPSPFRPFIHQSLESDGFIKPGDNYSSSLFPGRRKSTHGEGDLLAKSHHICPHCSYRALSRSKLVVHMRSHSGERPFACHVCSYRSINRGNLTAHLRTHAGEEPYQCKVCEYKAKYRREFLDHMKRQHGYL